MESFRPEPMPNSGSFPAEPAATLENIEVPSRTTEAAKILRTGRTRLMDVGSVTFTNATGEHDRATFLESPLLA